MSKKKETPEDVRRWFEREVKKLWPAARGSVVERRNRCVNPNCRLCRSGEKHLSHVLYLRKEGRSTSIHVPRDMVELMKEAVSNGRELDRIIAEAGERLLRALKAERARRKKDRKNG